MNERLVLIGKATKKGKDRRLIEYEARSGKQKIWIPQPAIQREESLGGELYAFLLTDVDTDAGAFRLNKEFAGAASPLVIEQDHILIVDALENDEPLPEEVVDDTIPALGVDTFDLANLDEWNFVPLILPPFVPIAEDMARTTAVRMQRVNGTDGKPAFYCVFNPSYDSPKEPAGAFLGTVDKETMDRIIPFEEALLLHEEVYPDLWYGDDIAPLYNLQERGRVLQLTFDGETIYYYDLLDPVVGWYV